MSIKDKNLKDETIAIHAGREPFNHEGAVNPPVQHASTILFETYDEFVKASLGKLEKSHYGRHGTCPNRMLEEVIAKLEGADDCLITNSGVSAITTALLAFLQPGDELLMVDSAYSPTREFCDEELKRFNISTRYYDPNDDQPEISEYTKVLFLESPGSLTMEVQDVPKLTKLAKEHGVVTIIDNTWGTPLYLKSFEHGIDVSIHSATKYIGGHSDLLMGIINCRKQHYKKIKRVYKNLGICPGPDDIYLAQRGLRTMAVRLKSQYQAGVELAKLLEKHNKVKQVMHPALKSHPRHKIWKRDFLGAAGLFSFVLKDKLSKKQKDSFYNKLKLFKIGYSWGGYESLILPFDPTKIRTATSWEEEGDAIRISVGLESLDDLKADLLAALERI